MPLLPPLLGYAIRKGSVTALRDIDPAERIRRALDEGTVRADRELGQVAYAAVKGLLAQAMGSSPTADDVGAVMAALAEDPAAPSRAHRLLGEARKTASAKRKQLLAAVYFGLPFTDVSEGDRDRIDMLVERLVTEDVELLSAIARLEATEPSRHGHPGCFVLTHGDRYLVGSSFLQEDEHRDEDLANARRLDGAAFTSLMAHGCVAMPAVLSANVTFNGVGANAEYVEITPLGRLLLHALEAVRAGMDDLGLY